MCTYPSLPTDGSQRSSGGSVATPTAGVDMLSHGNKGSTRNGKYHTGVNIALTRQSRLKERLGVGNINPDYLVMDGGQNMQAAARV